MHTQVQSTRSSAAAGFSLRYAAKIYVCALLLTGPSFACVQAKCRLTEKRAFFGREAIVLVAGFFADGAYANKPKVIAKYAQWAVRGNGPALFGKPTPITCVVGKGAAGYMVSRRVHLSVPTATNNVI